jgi:hypothetical protein
MMLLSRAWYVLLACVVGIAIYSSYLAVGQYNRRNAAAVGEELAADTQAVGWALQLDARRRLDSLLVGSIDPTLRTSLAAANGKDQVPDKARIDASQAVAKINDSLRDDVKSDAIFAVDREGRVIGQAGIGQLGIAQWSSFPDLELGGYPAIFDAIHGFLRDDTLVLGGKMIRVVARPVEADDFATPPLGAVVGFELVDSTFAADLSKRTRANIAFYTGTTKLASSPSGDFDATAFDLLTTDLPNLATDKSYGDTGRSDIRPLGDLTSALYARLPGEAWELGGGYAVLRTRVAISGPKGFLDNADDTDKKSVSLPLIFGIIFVSIVVGIAFSVLEHNLPLRALTKQAAKLKKGELDFFQLSKFRGDLRGIAADVNSGIERIIERGGGPNRRPADLEQILGPVPQQPAMSAFNFPGPSGGHSDGPVPTQHANPPPPPMGNPAMAGISGPQITPQMSGPMGPRPGFPGQPGMSQGVPPMNLGHGHVGQVGDRANLAHTAPMGLGPPMQQGGMGMVGQNTAPMNIPRQAPPPPRPAAGMSSTIDPTLISPTNENPVAQVVATNFISGEEEEATMVGQVPADVLLAATGQMASGGGPEQDWKQIYEEFRRTKMQCGEPVDGLTYAKFEQTLAKNRDALIYKHHCKRVRFSVYVKEGRASLKATPVKE